MTSKNVRLAFSTRILFTLLATLTILAESGCATTDSAPSKSTPQESGKNNHTAPESDSDNSGNNNNSSNSEGNNANVANAAENTNADIDAAQLGLPSEIERIDIDRFFRERRTLYVKFLPLDPKFAEIHKLFGHQLVRDQEADLSLRAQLGKDLRLTHWLFVFGTLELNERLSDPGRTLLLEEQKAVIAHYMRTLSFIGKFMDEQLQTERYKIFLTRLYKSIAARHLYRNVRGRQKR